MDITLYEESAEKIKKYVYILFACCSIFYTSYLRLSWNSYEIPYFIDGLFKILNPFKFRVLIPLLLMLETFTYVIKIKKKDIDPSFFYKYLLLVFFYFLTKVYVDSWVFSDAILLAYFCKTLPFRKVVYVYLLIAAVLGAIDLISVQKGLVFESHNGRGLTFGFSHSNYAAECYTMFLFALVYSLRSSKWLRFLICIPFFILTFAVFKSRTATILIFALAILLLLEPVYIRLSSKTALMRKIKMLFIFLPVIMMILSIILGIAIYYDVIHLDERASTRFIELVLAYKEKGLAIRSRSFADFSIHYYFDNGYGRLFLVTGLIFALIMHILFVLNNVRIAKENNYIMMVLFSIIYVYMLMEFVFAVNFPFILLGYFFAKPDSPSDKKDVFDTIHASSISG